MYETNKVAVRIKLSVRIYPTLPYINAFVENVQHMQPVQNCTGFIFCKFHAVVTITGSLSNKIMSYWALLVRITRIVFICSMAQRCIYTNIFRDPLHGIAS